MRVLALTLFLLSTPLRVPAQEEAAPTPEPPLPPSPVLYTVSFEGVEHHEVRIEAVFPELGDSALELRMSRTSPGRYALHEFAKNVFDVEIRRAGGGPAVVRRPHLHGWDVTDHGGEVRLSYRLFGDRTDGTYTGIDGTHAHLNMPATFVWARGLEDRPIRVTFRLPPDRGWRVSTQLVPTDRDGVFTAPSLDYFLDSPVEVSAHEIRSFRVSDHRESYEIRVALHQGDAPASVDRYLEGVEAIVREQGGVFGEYPAFDFGSYTFLADYLPWAEGDGMEHRNSTVLTSSSSIRSNRVGLLGTVAHEFFHAWNMERIRPESLEPFDFLDGDRNMSDALWFGEGFTSYYDDLTLRRAGIIDDRELARRLGRAVDQVVNAPGRRFRSPVEMSRMALFTDRASFADPTNLHETFVSYYTWGSVLGLALDLSLRTRFPGVTLDDYMRTVWDEHGRTFRPYDLQDLERILGEVTGDHGFAGDFFARYVRGRDVPDFRSLLATVGFLLRPAHPDRTFLGRAELRFDRTGAHVVSPTYRGTPLHRIGVGRGDRILALDGQAISGRRVFDAVMGGKKPGDTILVTYESRGLTRTRKATLGEDRTLEGVPFEDAGREAGDRALERREAWLRSRALPPDGG